MCFAKNNNFIGRNFNQYLLALFIKFKEIRKIAAVNYEVEACDQFIAVCLSHINSQKSIILKTVFFSILRLLG